MGYKYLSWWSGTPFRPAMPGFFGEKRAIWLALSDRCASGRHCRCRRSGRPPWHAATNRFSPGDMDFSANQIGCLFLGGLHPIGICVFRPLLMAFGFILSVEDFCPGLSSWLPSAVTDIFFQGLLLTFLFWPSSLLAGPIRGLRVRHLIAVPDGGGRRMGTRQTIVLHSWRGDAWQATVPLLLARHGRTGFARNPAWLKSGAFGGAMGMGRRRCRPVFVFYRCG